MVWVAATLVHLALQLWRDLDRGLEADPACGTSALSFYVLYQSHTQLPVVFDSLCLVTLGSPHVYVVIVLDEWKSSLHFV